MFRFFLVAAVLFSTAAFSFAQTAPNTKKPAAAPVSAAVKSSPAYAELLLRKVERESELQELALNYTNDYPRVKELTFEINLINQALEKVSAVKAENAAKLTLALGKLMVRRTELGIDLWKLHQQFTEEVPEIKKLRRKIEIFEQAIDEILQ